jgi:3-oxoacyl-[acyl-carrier-protein] synthase II
MFVLERFDEARARSANVYGEVVGYAMNSDASDFVLPNSDRQAECIQLALRRAELNPEDVDIVSTHATGTISGDAQESQALRKVWRSNGRTLFNNTKSFIGHAMGAAGALELAGNLPAFDDGVCHATINLDRLDPECEVPGLVANHPREIRQARTILNNSFGMLGINSVVIVRATNRLVVAATENRRPAAWSMRYDCNEDQRSHPRHPFRHRTRRGPE